MMHIAILVTNTDDSDFSQHHPRDGEKFTALLSPLRPDWRFSVHVVKDGDFPESLAGIDGLIVTGSPASVHDGAPWIARLLGLIRQAAGRGVPVFGACFGHQAVAVAFGGTVERNPGGWVLGLVGTVLEGQAIRLYAAHLEQVAKVPPDARVIGASPGCPVAAMRIGAHVLTTQYHPEMTHRFIAALVEELAATLPPEVIAAARASLADEAETGRIAEVIAAFFEGQDSAASRSIAVT
ncbi:MAG: type 1 glutamine amidotransferase [Gemmobacter sp.]